MLAFRPLIETLLISAEGRPGLTLTRQRILSALAGLIWEWDRQGRPPGPTPSTSFPEWAGVVGGILVCCGLGDPCLPQFDGTFTKDTVTEDMTALFRLAHNTHSTEWLSSRTLRDLIAPDGPCAREDDCDLFPQWDLKDRKGQTAFGKALQQYKGRILGGIRMEADEHDKNRIRYRFLAVEAPNPPGRTPPEDQLCGPCGLKNQSAGGGGVPVCGPKQVHNVHDVHISGGPVPPRVATCSEPEDRSLVDAVNRDVTHGGYADSNHSDNLNSLTGRQVTSDGNDSTGEQPVQRDDRPSGCPKSPSLQQLSPLPPGLVGLTDARGGSNGYSDKSTPSPLTTSPGTTLPVTSDPALN